MIGIPVDQWYDEIKSASTIIEADAEIEADREEREER